MKSDSQRGGLVRKKRWYGGSDFMKLTVPGVLVAAMVHSVTVNDFAALWSQA
jgi:hypothetical protein